MISLILLTGLIIPGFLPSVLHEAQWDDQDHPGEPYRHHLGAQRQNPDGPGGTSPRQEMCNTYVSHAELGEEDRHDLQEQAARGWSQALGVQRQEGRCRSPDSQTVGWITEEGPIGGQHEDPEPHGQHRARGLRHPTGDSSIHSQQHRHQELA